MLSDIDPDAMVVGSGTFPLTVTGSGFTPDSVVVFDDADVPTEFVSATELTPTARSRRGRALSTSRCIAART